VATRILGAKKKPNHQNSPPKATFENNKVRRGKRVIKIRKKTPWFCQKIAFLNSTSVEFIKRVVAPVMAKKIIAIFIIVFMKDYLTNNKSFSN
tara:strand:- start:193 stop:471 length:279 start_codon:yes stop_codon:yes gene_type:complete